MKYAVFASLLLIAFSSCDTSRYAYNPNAHNVPILAEKGDSKIGASYSNNLWVLNAESEDEYDKTISHGADVQGAIAVTNHLALQGSYSLRRERETYYNTFNNPFDSSKVSYKRNFFEAGVGYFTALDRKKRILFQVFGGVGFGNTDINDRGVLFTGGNYSRFYETDLNRFYLEPAITFRAREIFAASIATRFSVLNFRNIRTNYSFNEKQDLNLDSLDRYAVGFFEPVFVGSFGFNSLPGFRIEFQTGLSIMLADNFLNYRPFNFSVGLVFDVRKLMRGPVKN